MRTGVSHTLCVTPLAPFDYISSTSTSVLIMHSRHGRSPWRNEGMGYFYQILSDFCIFLPFAWIFMGFCIFNDFQWFLYIFMYFQWFSCIFVDFQWFSMIFMDFELFTYLKIPGTPFCPKKRRLRQRLKTSTGLKISKNH